MSNTDRKLRVFLCHASQDKPIVRELYQRLLAEGWIDPWLDEEKLLPGQDWDLEIDKALATSDVVIVCISSYSVVKEGYVQKELRKVLNVADEKPEGVIFLIPLRLDQCEIPSKLKKLQYVDYFVDGSHKLLVSSLRIRAVTLSGSKIVTRRKPKNNSHKNRNLLSNFTDIEIHFITSGSGGVGKTMMSLMAMAYFVKQDLPDTVVISHDLAANSDLFAFWYPVLSLVSTVRHNYGLYNLGRTATSCQIYGVEALGLDHGFRWVSLLKILKSVEFTGNRAIILIDSGSSLASVILNAGTSNIFNKYSNIKWRIIPWTIWTPASMRSENFIRSQDYAIGKLQDIEKALPKNRLKVFPIHVINPVPTSILNMMGINNLAERNPRLIKIQGLDSYLALRANGLIRMEDFVSIVTSKFRYSLEIDRDSKDLYEIIASFMQKFLIRLRGKEKFRYANIFSIPFIDVNLIGLKHEPTILQNTLKSLKKHSLENSASPVENLGTVFGKIYEAVAQNLDSFYNAIKKLDNR